jgi:hypothetical protein
MTRTLGGAVPSTAPVVQDDTISPVIVEVAEACQRLDRAWGEQGRDYPDGTGPGEYAALDLSDLWARAAENAKASDALSWRLLILAKMSGAFAERTPQALRGALVQVAALACTWIRAIDRRTEGMRM